MHRQCYVLERMCGCSLVLCVCYDTKPDMDNMHAPHKPMLLHVAKWVPSCQIQTAQWFHHYDDVIMTMLASQITSLTVVYSIVYSGVNQRKTSKLRVTGLCAGNSPGTGEFPAQMASYAENASIWWRHHVLILQFELWMKNVFFLKRVPDQLCCDPLIIYIIHVTDLTKSPWPRHASMRQTIWYVNTE